VSGRSRLALAACWVVVAGLLLRMAWGGSLFGILYVVRVVHPLTLLVGAITILAAGGLTVGLLNRPSRGMLWVSVGLSTAAIPYGVVLAGDGHGSAGALGLAAAAALAIAIHTLDRPGDLAGGTPIVPTAPDTGDQRGG